MSNKKVLVQLDTDAHTSPFDAIVAIDAGVDVLLPYAGVTPDNVPDLVQGAMFPRGPQGLVDTAVWVGGSKVRDGEAVLDAVQRVFFDPFRLSVMHDSDGCNTTAAAGVARVRSAIELDGARAVVVGAGPVGLRSAELLRREGADVSVAGLPAELLGDRPYRRAAGLTIAEDAGLTVVEPADRAALRRHLDGATVVLAAGPAGVPLLDRASWAEISSLRVVVDYSATEPVGIEGVESTDDLVERDGKLVLGALAVGGPKLKVQRAALRALFERPGQTFALDGIYDLAREII